MIPKSLKVVLIQLLRVMISMSRCLILRGRSLLPTPFCRGMLANPSKCQTRGGCSPNPRSPCTRSSFLGLRCGADRQEMKLTERDRSKRRSKACSSRLITRRTPKLLGPSWYSAKLKWNLDLRSQNCHHSGSSEEDGPEELLAAQAASASSGSSSPGVESKRRSRRFRVGFHLCLWPSPTRSHWGEFGICAATLPCLLKRTRDPGIRATVVGLGSWYHGDNWSTVPTVTGLVGLLFDSRDS